LGSATRAASTPGTATTSAGWWSRRSRGVTGVPGGASSTGGSPRSGSTIIESGRSVAAAASVFKVEPDAILVVHDESDLDAGRLQARMGGGFAGHNGLKSVASHIGTPDFLRLRVGVGRPGRGDRRPLADWVLSDFEPDEDAERLVSRAADAVESLDAAGLEATQQRFN
jgi:PTH1 family peptidyl-tRNA hydrolase